MWERRVGEMREEREWGEKRRVSGVGKERG